MKSGLSVLKTLTGERKCGTMTGIGVGSASPGRCGWGESRLPDREAVFRHRRCLVSETTEERFSFRWGISLLDEGMTVVPNFFFDTWARVGVTQSEFLFILHLARYHYESELGEARPGLETVARQMGRSVRTVQRLRLSLEGKGLLRVTPRMGTSSVYDLAAFSEACLACYLDGGAVSRSATDLTPKMSGGDTSVTRGVTLVSPEEQKTRTREKNNNKDDVVFSNSVLSGLGSIGMTAGGITKLRGVWSEQQIAKALAHVVSQPHIHNPAGYLLKLAGDGRQPDDFVPLSAAEKYAVEADDDEKAAARRCWERDRQPCKTVKTGQLGYTWCRFCDVAKVFVVQEGP